MENNIMYGNTYRPDLCGTIVRETKTLFIVKCDDGGEARVKKSDVVQRDKAQSWHWHLRPEEEVKVMRETYAIQEASAKKLRSAVAKLSVTLGRIHNSLWSAYNPNRNNVVEELHKKSLVSVDDVTVHVTECNTALQNLMGNKE